MASQSYERILIRNARQGSTVELARPFFGDLLMKSEGGRTVIEQIGPFGGVKIYVPSMDESIEAERY